MYITLWQSVLFTTALAAPFSLFSRSTEAVPSCSSKIAALNWNNPLPPWITPNKGSEFCISKWDAGLRIQGIAMFRQSNAGQCDGHGAINRVEVRFSDQSKINIGVTDPSTQCDAGTLVVADNELISDVRSWPACDQPGYQGQLEIRTTVINPDAQSDQDKKFNPQDDAPAFQGDQGFPLPVGGGVLIGMMGHISGDGVVTHITPIMAPHKVTGIKRTNYQYDVQALQQKNAPTQADVYASSVHNAMAVTGSATFTHQREISHTTSSEHLSAYTFGASITMKEEVSFLKIASVSSEQTLSYQYSNSDDSMSTNVSTINDMWSYSTPIDPWTDSTCYFVFAQASGEYPYTCDIVIEYDNGDTWTYGGSGSIHASLASTNAVTNCTEVNIPHGGGSSSSSSLSSTLSSSSSSTASPPPASSNTSDDGTASDSATSTAQATSSKTTKAKTTQTKATKVGKTTASTAASPKVTSVSSQTTSKKQHVVTMTVDDDN